jgi:hypothetical protein
MRKAIGTALAVFFAIALPPASAGADAPKEIVNIRLGGHIDDYRNLLIEASDREHWELDYLSIVEIVPPEGYRAGELVYGTCKDPGRILRIKLKTSDRRKDFFDRLFRVYKRKFGEPDIYKGDPFGAFIAWKWEFQDERGNRVTMILQFYHGKDEEHPGGTTMKLTANTLRSLERQCWLEKHPEGEEGFYKDKKPMPRSETGIEWFVPK